MDLINKINLLKLKLQQFNFREFKLSALTNNKFLLLIALVSTSLVMFGYIIVAPSSVKQTNTRSLSYNQKIQPTASIITPTEVPLQSISPTIFNDDDAPVLTPTPTPTRIPTPSLTLTPTPNPFANWKTYLSVAWGYRIKYPPDWKVQNYGALEPKIPSYIIFNPINASAGARSITISGSTRTYEEQTAIDGLGTPLIVAGTAAVKQNFQDSYGQRSTAITIPRTNYLIILRSKTSQLTTFNQMLAALQIF